MKLELSPTIWVPLQICEGYNAFSAYGILSTFSKPLSDAKISIFNASTFSTDYVFLQQKDLDTALKILQENLSVMIEDVENAENLALNE